MRGAKSLSLANSVLPGELLVFPPSSAISGIILFLRMSPTNWDGKGSPFKQNLAVHRETRDEVFGGGCAIEVGELQTTCVYKYLQIVPPASFARLVSIISAGEKFGSFTNATGSSTRAE